MRRMNKTPLPGHEYERAIRAKWHLMHVDDLCRIARLRRHLLLQAQVLKTGGLVTRYEFTPQTVGGVHCLNPEQLVRELKSWLRISLLSHRDMRLVRPASPFRAGA